MSAKERFRELIDVPEKIGLAVGGIMLTAGLIFKRFNNLINPGLALIAFSTASLLLTNAVWPKKPKTA